MDERARRPELCAHFSHYLLGSFLNKVPYTSVSSPVKGVRLDPAFRSTILWNSKNSWTTPEARAGLGYLEWVGLNHPGACLLPIPILKEPISFYLKRDSFGRCCLCPKYLKLHVRHSIQHFFSSPSNNIIPLPQAPSMEQSLVRKENITLTPPLSSPDITPSPASNQ